VLNKPIIIFGSAFSFPLLFLYANVSGAGEEVMVSTMNGSVASAVDRGIFTSEEFVYESQTQQNL
jgi:hypothetical protein